MHRREAGRMPLDLDLPLIAGPMSGGPSTPELVADVSGAGGLGFLGAGYTAPDRIRDDIRAVRAATDRAFGVNLFVPGPFVVDPSRIEAAVALLAPYREELGLPRQEVPTSFAQSFDDQVAAVLEEGVPVFSVTFGTLAPDLVERFQRAGTLVGATATTPSEATACAATGVDFVVAQGSEAGGHRGSFLVTDGEDLIGMASLVPQVADATGLPVVAAGGIVDGRGVRAALDLGACAAQLGTAFLLCPEAGTSLPYREAVRNARSEDTIVTSAFSGRRARGLVNRFALDLLGVDDLPPYPIMNALTRDLRQASADRGDAGLLSLWAGQSVGRVREMPAADLVELIAAEAGCNGLGTPAPGASLPREMGSAAS
ncbi:MAG: NAD(P)H-dependent flavin oxidoreductase [Acidimicrobiales bacterium]